MDSPDYPDDFQDIEVKEEPMECDDVSWNTKIFLHISLEIILYDLYLGYCKYDNIVDHDISVLVHNTITCLPKRILSVLLIE